jgi:hypothetical protein
MAAAGTSQPLPHRRRRSKMRPYTRQRVEACLASGGGCALVPGDDELVELCPTHLIDDVFDRCGAFDGLPPL